MNLIAMMDPFETVSFWAFKISEVLIYVAFVAVFTILSLRHLIRLVRTDRNSSSHGRRGKETGGS